MTKDLIRINLKALRQKAGLSLTKTAKLTGVSKAMLGQIERGESSPTLQTIWKLAKGFHLPLTAFVNDLSVSPSTAHITGYKRVEFEGEFKFETLFPFDPKLGYETFMNELEPHQTYLSAAHDIGVTEDIIVVSGQMDVLLNNVWAPCSTGQALRFAADQPHGYRNPNTKVARFVNTMHYPKTNILAG